MFKKLFLLVCLPILAFSQSAPINIDRIVAKVDNYIILRSEVEQLYIRGQQQQQPVSKCQALESMVVNKLLVAKAEIDSVLVEDKEVEAQLTARMQQMVQLYGNEKNIIEQFGKSLETLKSEVRSQVKEQLTAQKMQGKITEDLKITPNEVRRFFNRIPKDSIPEIPTEVELAHIVRLAKVTKAQKDELSERLLDYKRRVLAGEKFEDLAKEYSEDPGSRQFGGDLSWAKRGQMVPQFEAVAMKLKPNEISDVVESDFGLHLIQTLEVRGQEYHARHILLRPDYNRLDITDAKKFLDSIRTEIVKDSIKFEKAAKEFSEDKQTQDGGGILLDPQSGSSKMALDESMEPTLYFTIDTMKVGTITVPLPYRSEDGKTGVRIIYYKAKHAPHKASLNEDFERLKEFAIMEKRNVEIEKWFKKATADVYIKIDPEFESCNIFGKDRISGGVQY
ncbi:PpiC-type peptidyl-prolyl cis-trans isomerase [Emticicia oligotrophica DSM 17448]|uniref:PpiC-type peptidyl-prolyl cis-trans isomerase n=1 Tax=Emticicia oligotrophica (strain DSM 17448 / CIP 109782 / MTCC 6937 / GPTSA100-15) TaxID=929562 RepID=A0ABM5N314_EMTOG|nr:MULTISPECIES: peptidylprolyl isomerase [Emticicia]AFK03816.1 PpiC-type peptidyl-prolyl cis-trans isomerase [Emticicia oligotrophica DSM 17448]